jgi:hypothetical protein
LTLCTLVHSTSGITYNLRLTSGGIIGSIEIEAPLNGRDIAEWAKKHINRPHRLLYGDSVVDDISEPVLPSSGLVELTVVYYNPRQEEFDMLQAEIRKNIEEMSRLLSEVEEIIQVGGLDINSMKIVIKFKEELVGARAVIHVCESVALPGNELDSHIVEDFKKIWRTKMGESLPSAGECRAKDTEIDGIYDSLELRINGLPYKVINQDFPEILPLLEDYRSKIQETRHMLKIKSRIVTPRYIFDYEFRNQTDKHNSFLNKIERELQSDNPVLLKYHFGVCEWSVQRRGDITVTFDDPIPGTEHREYWERVKWRFDGTGTVLTLELERALKNLKPVVRKGMPRYGPFPDEGNQKKQSRCLLGGIYRSITEKLRQ